MFDEWTPTIPDADSGIDLSSFCRAPYQLTAEEMELENARELFNRIPQWDNESLRFKRLMSPSGELEVRLGECFAAGSFGQACDVTLYEPRTKKSQLCVAKWVLIEDDDTCREAIREFMIHAILSHTCATDPYMLDRQTKRKMAKIATLYAAFRASGYNLDGSGRGVEYMIMVMERADRRSLKSFVEANLHDQVALFLILSISFYQISSFLSRLTFLEFNHRDLHLENILANTTDTLLCSDINAFTCCIIDFGYSRLTFRGKHILGLKSRLGNPEQRFNMGHDVVYFASRVYKTLCGTVNIEKPCSGVIVPEMLKFLQALLVSSGLNFRSDACLSTTRKLITALTYVGDMDSLNAYEDGRFAGETIDVRPYLYQIETVKRLSASLVRIVLYQFCVESEADEVQKHRDEFNRVLSGA